MSKPLHTETVRVYRIPAAILLNMPEVTGDEVINARVIEGIKGTDHNFNYVEFEVMERHGAQV